MYIGKTQEKGTVAIFVISVLTLSDRFTTENYFLKKNIRLFPSGININTFLDNYFDIPNRYKNNIHKIFSYFAYKPSLDSSKVEFDPLEL